MEIIASAFSSRLEKVFLPFDFLRFRWTKDFDEFVKFAGRVKFRHELPSHFHGRNLRVWHSKRLFGRARDGFKHRRKQANRQFFSGMFSFGVTRQTRIPSESLRLLSIIRKFPLTPNYLEFIFELAFSWAKTLALTRGLANSAKTGKKKREEHSVTEVVIVLHMPHSRVLQPTTTDPAHCGRVIKSGGQTQPSPTQLSSPAATICVAVVRRRAQL